MRCIQMQWVLYLCKCLGCEFCCRCKCCCKLCWPGAVYVYKYCLCFVTLFTCFAAVGFGAVYSDVACVVDVGSGAVYSDVAFVVAVGSGAVFSDVACVVDL